MLKNRSPSTTAEHSAPNTGVSLASLLRRPKVGYDDLAEFDPNRPVLTRDITNQVEIQLKYAGYIKRQLKQVEDFARMEDMALPADLDYSDVPGLRTEARQKLAEVRPDSFGRAGRISGVSPADMAALAMYLGRRRR